MIKKPGFLASRYYEVVDCLKSLGLWTPQTGFVMQNLLAHCMPPPHPYYIYQLISDLLACGIKEEWAPIDVLGAIQQQIALLDSVKTKPENKGIAKKFPVAFGIHRITLHDWPQSIKARCIKSLVDVVYQHTGTQHTLSNEQYYKDVYQLRDRLICKLADSHGLIVKGKHREHLEDKRRNTASVLSEKRWIGCEMLKSRSIHKTSFWDDPPFVPFVAELELKVKPKNGGSSVKVAEPGDSINCPIVTDKRGLKSTREQLRAVRFVIPRFVRNNVRSLADPSQLSMSAILSYWRRLLKKEKRAQLLVSLLTFLTGLHRDRWITAQIGSVQALTRSNVVFSPEYCRLYYVVQGGAANFEKGEIQLSECMTLALPVALSQALSDIESVFQRGVNEASVVRSFSKKFPGPSPTLNRTANSGFNLLRRTCFSESEASVISGKIPIEFRARNCYVSRDVVPINQAFSHAVGQWLQGLERNFFKNNDPLKEILKYWLSGPWAEAPRYDFGSQLNAEPVISSGLAPSVIQAHSSQQRIESCIEEANLLELHLYWMLQYSYANRPAGKGTQSLCDGRFRLHADKSSAYYQERKLLRELPLIRQQIKENIASRQAVSVQLRRLGVDVDMVQGDDERACLFEFKRRAGRCVMKPLDNASALKLAQRYWGITSTYNRPNVSRHQCATHMQSVSHEVMTDTWLGHHIDGWYAFAPESSCSAPLLYQLQQLQEQWLDQQGFRFRKSPFL